MKKKYLAGMTLLNSKKGQEQHKIREKNLQSNDAMVQAMYQTIPGFS